MPRRIWASASSPASAADDAGLPPDPELRAALRSYMEWANSEVMSYQDAESVVPPQLTAPRWSWDGLQP